MEKTAELLADILEKQIDNYDTLKRLAFEKRKSLSNNDLKLLAKVTADIQTVAASNNRLEEERAALADKLASELSLSEPNPTLAQITEHLSGPLAERLRALRTQAVAAIHEVQRQNRINAEMLKYCSNLMDSVVKSLVEPGPNRTTYGCTGGARWEVAPAALLDHHM